MHQLSLASGPTIGVGRTGSSLSDENLCGGRVDLVACLATGEQHVRKLSLSSLMSTDTNLFVCAGQDYNKALSSGLIAEERTRQLLEIAVAEHDYRVALSKVNLRSSRPWAFFEES